MSSASSSSLPHIGERPPLPPLIDVLFGRHRPQRLCKDAVLDDLNLARSIIEFAMHVVLC